MRHPRKTPKRLLRKLELYSSLISLVLCGRDATGISTDIRGNCSPNVEYIFGGAEWGFGLAVHSSNPSLAMSALGQKRTLQCILVMSALPPKADIDLGVLRSPLRAISGRSGDRWI